MNKTYNKSLVFIASCAGLAFFGVTMLSLGLIIPHLKQDLGDVVYRLPATLPIGIIIGTLIFGPVVDRFGYKNLLIIGSVVALLGVQGLANLSEMWMLYVSILLVGIGGGILNGETNVLVAEIYDDKTRGGKLGILGAFFCIGALTWTLMVHVMGDFRLPLNIISAVKMAFVVFYCLIQFPQAKPQSKGASFKDIIGLLKYPALLIFAFVLFFQSGLEAITNNFTPSFLNETKGMSDIALSLTWVTIGMLIGRFLLGTIMNKLGDIPTLYLFMGIALVGFIVLGFVVTAATPILVYIAMALIGFGVGATFPVVFNFLGATFKEMSGTAFSIAIFIGLCGNFTLKRIMGWFFENGQFGNLPIAMIFATIMIMILLPLAKSKIKK